LNIDELYALIMNCNQPCSGEKTRGLVRDIGDPKRKIVFLGEAPGAEEIKKGCPFSGQAGTKLASYLGLANLTREDIFILNTVKCRPTKNNGRANRKPSADEIKKCAFWLDEELKLISPNVVVTLGDVALQRLGGKKHKLGTCHGQPFTADDYIVYPMYHPAAAIYRRDLEQVIEEDFRALGLWLRSLI